MNKKISLITLILVIIVALAIGIGVGYLVTMNINDGQITKEASSEEAKTQTEKIVESKNTETNAISNTVTETPKKEEETTQENTNENSSRMLNQNELDLFEKYLESPGIWNFIYTPYSNLTEFNLSSFLRYYYDSVDATAEQIKDITGEDDPPVPLHLFSKTNIDELFKEHTGKDVSIINKDLLPSYSEKHDSYYNRTSDADFMDIDVISGTEYNSKYIIRYTTDNYNYGETTTFELTLNKVNGEYLFVSNVII